MRRHRIRNTIGKFYAWVLSVTGRRVAAVELGRVSGRKQEKAYHSVQNNRSFREELFTPHSCTTAVSLMKTKYYLAPLKALELLYVRFFRV